MPNRIIKETIRSSETIDELTWFEEVFFYRLVVSCDDYGRFDARPKILRSSCFPLKAISDQEVVEALQRLEEVGLLETYEVDGKPFLQLTAWSRHQRLRTSKQKYPAKEKKDNSPQVAASCCKSRPESEYESEYEYESESEYESEEKKLPAVSKTEVIEPEVVGAGKEKSQPTENADRIIDYLNQCTGSRYRHSDSSRRHIVARLNDGFTVNDCIVVINKKCADWLGNDKMAKFLRPETLFGSKFENYLNQPERATYENGGLPF